MFRTIKNIIHFFEAHAAAVYYRNPGAKLKIIGVTGTDGKTTTVHMIGHVLKSAGYRVAILSSIGATVSDEFVETGFHTTTPSSRYVQKFLRDCANKRVEYVVLEVTSHALDQHRVEGIKFAVGVLTNITHEHLDYHKNIKNYIKSKANLFKNTKINILNYDDASYNHIKRFIPGRIFTYSLFQATDFNMRKVKLSIPLEGRYNLSNALAAMAVAEIVGVPENVILRALSKFNGIPGRLEKIDHGQRFKVYVDFAHTPNGLRSSLIALKKKTKGRVIAVFGAAGKRDTSKRPLMGQVAQSVADVVILTAEDPRGENVASIMSQIAAGSRKAGGKLGKNLFKIASRSEAIEYAIGEVAKSGDTVVLLGKGHERSINLDGKRELPWSDQAEASRAILRKIRYA